MRKIFYLFFLIFIFSTVASAQEINIIEAINLSLKNDVDDFILVENKEGYWWVKAVNQNNGEECELRINKSTGVIEYCTNVIPKDIIIGENTYGFSGKIYSKEDSIFYSDGEIANGFKIYRSDDRYFQMRRAIFIKNLDNFVAYFIYKGPDVIKGAK